MRDIPESVRREIMRAGEAVYAVTPPRIASEIARFQRTREALQASIPVSLLEQIATWRRMIEQRAEEERLFAPFVENGLCLAPSMPQELIDECVRRHEAGESVVDYILTWSQAEEWTVLKDMVQPWKSHPFLAARSEIFEEALHAHTSGHYAASVALLVSQPEGVALDWVYDSNAMLEVQREKQSLPKKRERAEREHQEMLELTEGSGYHPDDLQIAYAAWYVTMIVGMQGAGTLSQRGWTSMHTFVQFGHKLLYKQYRLFEEHDTFMNSEALNRHAIVHGSALRAGTEENSLRLFLALDVLALIRE